MSGILKVWNSLLKHLDASLQSGNYDQTSLIYWKNRLFSRLLLIVLILGMISLVPSVLASLNNGLTFLAYFDLFAYAVVCVTAFNPFGFSSTSRRIVLLVNFDLIAIVLLFELDPIWAPGFLFLFTVTIMCALILSVRHTVIFAIFNLLICLGVSLTFNFQTTEDLIAFSTIAVNENFLSSSCALGIIVLFKQLEKVLQTERLSRVEIEQTARVLKHQKRELEQFIYVASHDLREPMVTLVGLKNLMEHSTDSRDEGLTKQLVSKMTQPLESMNAKMTGLFKYSIIGRSQIAEQVDVSKIVDTGLVELLSLIESTNTKIIFEDLHPVYGYEAELRLLFHHLISNGIEFSNPEQSPVITITSEIIADKVVYCISDNGIGIPDGIREKVFQIFQVGHDRSDNRGIGLGLTICRKVVELHEGEIWIEKSSGDGTTFSFCLPRYAIKTDSWAER